MHSRGGRVSGLAALYRLYAGRPSASTLDIVLRQCRAEANFVSAISPPITSTEPSTPCEGTVFTVKNALPLNGQGRFDHLTIDAGTTWAHRPYVLPREQGEGAAIARNLART